MGHLKQRLFRNKGLPVSLALAMVLGTILGYASFGLAPRTQPATAGAMPADAKVMTAHTGTMQAGGRMQVHPQSQMPVRSAQEQQQEAAGLARIHNLPAAPHGPVAQVDTRALAAHMGPAVSAPKSAAGLKATAGQPLADTDFVVAQANNALGSGICPTDCAASEVMEPSIGNDGKYMWMSGNWFDALSANEGSSWGYVDPYTIFNPANEFFCCDQQALYEPSRNLMIWESLWLGNTASDPNSIILAFLPGNLSGVCWYNWLPASFGLPNTDLLDYPDIQYSNDNYWLTFNVYNGSGWLETVVMRAPLTPPVTCAGFSYSYYVTTANFSFALASGALGNMYFDSNWYTSSSGTGDHVHICAWGDVAASPACLDRAVPSWAFITTGQNCGSQDAVVSNWCTRLDSRRGALYVTKANYRGFGPSSLGMAWTAAAGGNPFPYVVRNYFNLAGFVYDATDYLYSTGFAIAYPSIAPNFRGFLGGSFAFGGGTGTADYYPSTFVIVDDPVSPTQPWTDYFPVLGAGNATAWGDYNTTRGLVPQGYMWVSAGWYMNGSAVVPFEVIYGRARDLGAYNRWSVV